LKLGHNLKRISFIHSTDCIWDCYQIISLGQIL
jgi:hypothetical protein